MLNSIPYTGEILILVILVLLNGRIFFTNTRIDSFVIMSPLTVVITILHILSWGADFTNVTILVLAVVSLIINYRSFLKFLNHLYVDQFHPVFIVFSSIMLLICTGFLAFKIWQRPVFINEAKFNVETKKLYYTTKDDDTDIAEGELVEAVNFSDRKRITLEVFSCADKDAEKDCAVLLVPDIKAGARNYRPLAVLLARNGYTVYTAQIDQRYETGSNAFVDSVYIRGFVEMLKWCISRADGPARPVYYENYCKALYRAARQSADEGTYFFFVTDGEANQAFRLSQESRLDREEFGDVAGILGSDFVTGSFSLNSVKEYKESPLGFIRQTEPAVSYLVFGRGRDLSLFEPSYCAYLIRQEIQKAMERKFREASEIEADAQNSINGNGK